MRGKPALDETGARYGRLVVLCKGDPFRTGFKWLCVCDCGRTHQATSNNLRTGNTKSCGKCGAFVLKGDEAACRQAHSGYRRHARGRGHSFELTVEQFRQITSRDCHYCGSPPSNRMRGAKTVRNPVDYIYNGIDRVNNEAGYILSNVVPCCHVCNRAKSDMPHSDFMEWISRLRNHKVA